MQENPSLWQNIIDSGLKPLSKKLKIESLLKPKPRIAVLSLHGVIGAAGKMKSNTGLSLQSLDNLIEKAFTLPRVKAVALCINSPGGSPAQSALISERIRQFSEEKSIPTYSFIEDVGTSGGYWLACTSDTIYAQPTSVVGSIGVITAGFGFKDLIAKWGIERRVYTQGENKNILDPFKEEKEEDVSLLLNVQKDIHEVFIRYVKERRADAIDAEDDVLFSGAFWSGLKAKELGLVDGIGSMHGIMQEKYGREIDFVTMESPKPFLAKLLGLDTLSSKAIAEGVMNVLEERGLWSRLGT